MITIFLIKLIFYFPLIWATTHWVVTQDGRITPQVNMRFQSCMSVCHLLNVNKLISFFKFFYYVEWNFDVWKTYRVKAIMSVLMMKSMYLKYFNM